MLKIGFDISQTAHTGGVAVYTKNLAENLREIEDLDMTYFFSSLRKPCPIDLPNIKKFKIPPTLLQPLINNLRVPIENFIGDVDIFHSSDWIQPKTKAKKVTTYHDVIPLKFPKWSDPKIVNVHKKRLEIVEKEIDMVIAVSVTTKKDLLEISKIPEEKIVVIYEGVGNNFKPQQQDLIGRFKKKYRLPDEFVLAISGIGERRNIVKIKQAAKDFNLVITGENLPFLKDEEMPLLYSSAQVLLYPSLYEGFGLPIIEAMACGTPVITSKKGSMAEISGDSALLVDPENVDDISNKLFDVIHNNELKKIITEKGLGNAKKFSWQNCAKETVEVYQKLLRL